MENDIKVLSAEEIYSLILKGILDAKGSEKAIELLNEKDCFKIGEDLANREALRNTNFFSVVIDPINDIEEGKAKGYYDLIDDSVNIKNFPLRRAEGLKRLYFVPITEIVEEGKEAEYLVKFRKRPVKNATNYFLGAMAKIGQEDLPENLISKNFVALMCDEEVYSVLFNFPCFLCSSISEGSRSLFVKVRSTAWDLNSVFIAEDIE